MTFVRWVAAAVLVVALAAPAAAAPARHYEGTGPRTLEPFRLTGPATLRWQTSGGLIGGLRAGKLLNARVDVPNPQIVFTRARTGSVRLRPGRYVLEINTLPGTRWQLTV